MFERFSDEARQVVIQAQQEARELRHNYIGTEHILLGLVHEQESVAAQVLASFGLTSDRARAQITRIVGSGEEVASSQIPFTPRAKKVLELSLREALSLGHEWIGPEHILLGIIRENEGVAARVMLDFGAESEKVRNEVMRMLPALSRATAEVRMTPPRAATYASREPIDVAWLDGLNTVLDRLGAEIRQEFHREPDVGDLLLVLACAPELLAGRVLGDLGVDLDALWGTVERVRGERAEAASELDRRREAARQAKEEAIEAQRFDEAAQLRDQERELGTGLRARWRVGPEVLQEIRRRLGLPEPPSPS